MTLKPSIFLHLPIHKTGSTALQRALFDNESRLNDFEFTYLPRFTVDLQHDAMMLKAGAELRILLRTMRDAGGSRNILLSTEMLHLREDDRIGDFLAAVTEVFAEYTIKVIVYLRRQDDAFSSYYNQIVKFGTVTETSAQAFARYERFFDYKRYLRIMRNGLREEDHLVTRVYNRATLVDRDIVADFLQVIGLNIDLPSRSNRVDNQSLEKSVFKLKLAMNHHLAGSPPDLIQNLAGVLEDVSSQINNGKPDANVLSELERSLIMDRYSASNRWVQEQFLSGASLGAEEKPAADYESSLELILPAVLARTSRYFYHIIKQK